MMKKAGIITTVAGTLMLVIMSFALFISRQWPQQIVVPLFLLSILSVCLGPALYVFAFSSDRRKKIANRSLILSILLIIIGLASAQMQIIGARMEVIIGVLIFCFFFGSLAFKNKYEKWRVYTRSRRDAFFLSLFDYLGIASVLLGFLFKYQRWPMASMMMTIGFIVLAAGMFAWNQKFKKEIVFRKKTEDQLKESFDEIELQKQKLEEKQKEIIDSIRYAKRIQHSRMPTEKYIESSIERLKKNGL